jgi:hypothetical protein
VTEVDMIRRNAQTYRRNVFRRDGSIAINHNQLVNQVFANLDLTTLSHADLQEVGYILAHMSRNVGLSAIIENDHREYWALVHSRFLASGRADYWIRDHNPLISLIDTRVMRFCYRGNKSGPQFEDAINNRFQNTLLQQLGSHRSYSPSVWSGFAYLEGLCRRICREQVTTDGTVKKPFRVSGSQYRSEAGRRRAKGKNKGSATISNLHHTLELTRRHISDHTRHALTRFFRDYPASQIFGWRNDSLHGSEDRETTIIVLYCLISILLLDVLQ